MKRSQFGFILGLLLGLTVGTAAGVLASEHTPRIVGGDGYLLGYDIIDQDSDILCRDPWVWTSTKEIECELED